MTLAGRMGFYSRYNMDFVLRHNVKSSSGAHPTPIQWFPEALQPLRGGDLPITSNDKVKNMYSYACPTPSVFMALYLMKHMNNISLTLSAFKLI